MLGSRASNDEVGTADAEAAAVGGGGYLRLYPMFVTKRLIERGMAAGIPTVVYVHPWELDTESPRFRLPFPTSLRHYAGTPSRGRKGASPAGTSASPSF